MKSRIACLLTAFMLLPALLVIAPVASVRSIELASKAPGTPQADSPAAALTGVRTVATGGSHTCVINQSDGSVSCWGANGSGQLGDGTSGGRDLPVKPVGLGTDIQDIAAGTAHSCAVTSAGALMCWGDGSEGQLGDNQRLVDRPAPVLVSGLTSGVKAVAAGSLHTCALMTNGTVKCWGLNDKSQLGDGTTARQLTPKTVPGLANVTAIAAGAKHTCAIVSGGALKCWGANLSGQVGNGTFSPFSSKTPQDVIGLSSGVTDVAGGDQHTCAVVNGAVRCWGESGLGQLGIGDVLDQNEPQTIGGLSAKRIAAGASLTCRGPDR